MEEKERATLKQTITSGYEYETEFIRVAQRVNKIILEKVWGSSPGAVMIKKNPHLLWENNHQQKACAVRAHKMV